MPMLTEDYKRKRIEWARKHIDDKWNKTTFTDEATFQLFRNTVKRQVMNAEFYVEILSKHDPKSTRCLVVNDAFSKTMTLSTRVVLPKPLFKTIYNGRMLPPINTKFSPGAIKAWEESQQFIKINNEVVRRLMEKSKTKIDRDKNFRFEEKSFNKETSEKEEEEDGKGKERERVEEFLREGTEEVISEDSSTMDATASGASEKNLFLWYQIGNIKGEELDINLDDSIIKMRNEEKSLILEIGWRTNLAL
ncbi:hypothetical protein Glove_219g147 [Diversispora epigaea]|uniref:Uncharacterized protein n=1 Tax=Diversispora epigaea TaxID=1348612 RepID=A0A397IJ12_9GLOM|nr:hypothetical protein Glove_219g147 [Diversispora epigaea]